MTAWSAARFALKIVRFTPSAGSLSESASSAAGGLLGALAQPAQSSSRPSTTTADADRAALARPAVRTARNTVIFLRWTGLAGSIVPRAFRRVKAATDGGRGLTQCGRYALPQ